MTDPIAAVRRFNRFYTHRIGVLREGHLASPYSLAEVRVLYELAQAESGLTASQISTTLDMDAGYLSRIIRGFERAGLISRSPSPQDARRHLLHLTPAGRAAFDELDAKQAGEVATLLEEVPDRARLLGALRTIETLLGAPAGEVELREHQPGDMGWLTYRHAVLYQQEYGWGGDFEALVAQVGVDFLRNFKPGKERCWIADRDGEILGSVFLVHESDQVAKLRLLYVEPAARGLGLGRQLVDACVAFAHQAGYERLTLWTNHVLQSARRIYEAAGFKLVAESPHTMFGPPLIGQTWELEL